MSFPEAYDAAKADPSLTAGDIQSMFPGMSAWGCERAVILAAEDAIVYTQAPQKTSGMRPQEGHHNYKQTKAYKDAMRREQIDSFAQSMPRAPDGR